jgi:hypothetical protein
MKVNYCSVRILNTFYRLLIKDPQTFYKVSILLIFLCGISESFYWITFITDDM